MHLGVASMQDDRAPCGRGRVLRDAAGRNAVFHSVEVHQDFALEHDHRLVGVGMDVQRSDLAVIEAVLEEEEGAVGLLRSGLPDVDAAAEEPAPLAFLLGSDDGLGGGDCAHGDLIRGTDVP